MHKAYALAILLLIGVSASGPSPDGSTRSKSAHAESEEPAHAKRWKAGEHYEIAESVMVSGSPPGTVEVIEVFWYGCSHCYTLESHLARWEQSNATYIDFRRMPTTWSPGDIRYAKLYYTLEVLGRTDLHRVIFDVIHQRREKLVTGDDTTTLVLQAEFAGAHGISAEQFRKAHASATVAARVERAQQFARHYRVLAVPSVIINGRYKTDLGRAGENPDALLSLVDALAATEHRRQSGGAGST